MTSATLTSPPTVTARLVVDTDVASFIFKWHPEFAPRYIDIVRGSELALSFMTLAEMRQGALDANWGQRKGDVLESYLADFKVLHSDSLLCSMWAAVRNESTRQGRPISSADAWIAATAMVLSVPLVTNNPKDYRHLDKLQLISAATESQRVSARGRCDSGDYP
jgi:tRNA(fMet)-specific endonuclease VapC